MSEVRQGILQRDNAVAQGKKTTVSFDTEDIKVVWWHSRSRDRRPVPPIRSTVRKKRRLRLRRSTRSALKRVRAAAVQITGRHRAPPSGPWNAWRDSRCGETCGV
jgi:hypothetical protein